MPEISRAMAVVTLLFAAAIAHAAEDCGRFLAQHPRDAAPLLRGLMAKAPNDAERAGLQTCLGYAFEQTGDINAAWQQYEQAVVLAERGGNPKTLGFALLMRGQVRYYRGEFSVAIEDLQRAYALFVSSHEEKNRREALNAIANLYADRRVAAYDRAIEFYRQLLASYDPAKDAANIATAHFNIASTLDTKGDSTAALIEFRRALELERARKDPKGVADVQYGLSISLRKLDRLQEALSVLDQALAYFVKAGDAENEAAVRLQRGTVLRRLGRNGEALRELEAARARFESTSSYRFLERTNEERALVFAATGDWRGAYEARGALMAVREKLSETVRDEHVSRLRVQFDSQKQEQENRALVRENALRARALADAARIRNLQRGVIVLGALVIGFLFSLVVKHLSTARRMRDLALTDELTKLPNRRHVLTFADEQLKSARSGGKGFAVLALDIDHFKRINDTLGHDAGDVVLRRVADVCRGALRSHDRMGRIGGEEFLVVLPESDANTAAEVAERLRSAVEQIDLRDLAPELRITVSIGVTEWKSADDFSSIVKRADDSLYRAKERGRNRVELAYA